jgi:hypothetical protein
MISPGPTGGHGKARRNGRRVRHGHGYRAGPRRARAVRDGAAGLAAALALGLLAVAACSSAQPRANLPPKSAAVSAPSPSLSAVLTPAPSPTPASSRQAVIAAYLALWPAADRAQHTRNQARARAILARYATPAAARGIAAGMAGSWRRHEVDWGAMRDHIMHVTVLTARNGQLGANVVDCQDAAHHGLARASGRHINHGPARAKLAASMTYQDRRWLVSAVTFRSNRC